MPITTKVKSKDGDELLINDYTLHSAMKRLYEIDAEGHIPILFVDELNRSEFSVQQELMQVLLAREINGNKLPDSTLLIAAGNNEDAGSIDYQVNVMNPALKDRMTMVEMKSDPQTWIEWGARKELYDGTDEEGNPKYISNIHPKILEFIATLPENLHSLNETSDVNPTPRSWFKASQMLRAKEKLNFSLETLTKALQGTVGLIQTTAFMKFMEDTENPLIQPKEILNDKPLSDELIEKIQSEEIARLFLSFRNFMDKFEDLPKKNKKQQYIDNITMFLSKVPRDSMYGMLESIVNDYRKSFDILSDKSDKFLDLNIETKMRLKQLNS